jgi:hypothetical protein
MKTTVIHHSADYDGIFCREIAKKFLPHADWIGWDFGYKPINPITEGTVYILDLPIDRPFGYDFVKLPLGGRLLEELKNRIVWIDHHKSSIESHPKDIPGYRIDGVAACRLAWQWFQDNSVPQDEELPGKVKFIEREVSEPLAVRLAGEYDIWDHRGDGDLEFQFGLDSEEDVQWQWLLDVERDQYARQIVAQGKCAMACYKKRDGDIMRERSFLVAFEGLKFLALNTARCNSNSFLFRDIPETGHDALLAFYWNGKKWSVSLYHAAHRKDIDLSLIAVKHGGGGHRGACGFQAQALPFLPPNL